MPTRGLFTYEERIANRIELPRPHLSHVGCAAYLAQLDGVASTATEIASLIQCNEIGPVFNELKDAREVMVSMFANPDMPLTSIVGLSHPRSVRLLIAGTDQIKRKNAVLVKLLEELQRRQVR